VRRREAPAPRARSLPVRATLEDQSVAHVPLRRPVRLRLRRPAAGVQAGLAGVANTGARHSGDLLAGATRFVGLNCFFGIRFFWGSNLDQQVERGRKGGDARGKALREPHHRDLPAGVFAFWWANEGCGWEQAPTDRPLPMD